METEWRPIRHNPDYSVSNTGQVRSETRIVTMKNGRQKTIFQRILKPRKCGAGYLQVDLGPLHGFYIHRLVAEEFIGDGPPGWEVNHIDEDKQNNTVSNLEWVPHIKNVMHGTRNKRLSDGALRRAKTVVAKKNGEIVMRFPSIHEARRHGFNRRGIQLCYNGSLRHYKGYEWSFEEVIG
ncbi:NUMOD4 motif-containing HNH endonuclease [Anaerotruncus colihominis]|uniref:NUMOD4 motif-containing HNH endonuclease n=1 Tax=Anaerotruncus colihominis TaxID=169435 RepID=UPI00242F4495|nr:NUMOD4 motif-containing HNH endonuclease [Anaerotruncus colihominis]